MTALGRHPEPLRGISNNALGALLTMLAMLCFAVMDAISKSLVVEEDSSSAEPANYVVVDRRKTPDAEKGVVAVEVKLTHR